ncbi:MAG: hypothetical protein GX444_16665 [Myxococcales bacterium]|nr:hypothetical protein [Myxococcales bacterium]
MKRRITSIVIFWILAGLFAACQRTDADHPWDRNSYGNRQAPAKQVLTITGADADYGDIPLRFTLDLPSGETRAIQAWYTGACGRGKRQTAVFGGEHENLAAGEHTITWWSWDQEAGCRGEVTIRLATDQGESAETSFTLDNTRDGLTGFQDYPQYDQGINDDEEAALNRALPALLADPTVDFVAFRVGDEYEVYAERGWVVFTREATRDGYEYVEESVEGENPLARQDPMWIPTYEEELAAGSNPNDIKLKKEGYPKGDPRLSFIEPEADSYPYAYERIAAYFDHPDSADLLINWKSYAHADADLGEHGSLNIVQSRSPLVFWGKGISPGMFEDPVRHVDIAPTVARLLGLPTTFGIDERGVWSHRVYLTQQDGHSIDSVLDGTTAEHVIILVLDGLAHTELMRRLQENGADLPNFMRLVEEGAVARYGSITNWPSVTYPSHNVIGSGVYSGHHGLVDNTFYLRRKMKRASPIDQMLMTEHFWNPVAAAETLHMAVHRNLGDWSPFFKTGAITASLMDPSVAGADKTDLEFRDQTHQVPFPPFGLKFPPGMPFPVPSLTTPWDIYFAQYTEMAALWQFFYLYENGVTPSPTYLIMNFSTTDSAGHVIGPHGDDMLPVLEHIDQDLGALFAWLEWWGLADKTALVLTSDHGMQLGDPSRSGWPLDSLNAVEVRPIADTWLGVYLAIPRLEFDVPALTPNEYQLFHVRVSDVDTDAPAANVEVTARDGMNDLQALTGEDGIAEFGLAPVADVKITVRSESMTRSTAVLPLQ